MVLKIVSVNIERDRHLSRVEAFLQKEQPDVLCLQEVLESDFPRIAEKLGMTGTFKSMGKYALGSGRGDVHIGVGILSRFPFEYTKAAYYYGNEDSVEKIRFQLGDNPDKFCKVFLYGKVKKEGEEFTIGTTHFTWSPKGEANDPQRRDIKKLLEALQKIGEIVFCGDFNAPRGREIFELISARYVDNIPQKYTTSIDVNLHRAGEELRGKPRMIDGLFSTPHYKASNVRLQDGVSDHLAIVGHVRYLENK